MLVQLLLTLCFLSQVGSAQGVSGCILLSDDRAYGGEVTSLTLQIYPNIVSETHADYTFQYSFNKTLTAALGDTVYAQVDFTNFFLATNLTLPFRQIQCQQERYMFIEHCAVIQVENIVEVGYIRDYPLNRVDFPDGSFCNMFYQGAFTIKNMPTPYAVFDEYPAIDVRFFNGTGGTSYEDDQFMMEASVVPEFRPADIPNFGTVLDRVYFDEASQRVVDPEIDDDADLDPASLELVNTIDLFFTPSVAIFNNSYIEILFPREITLPLSVDSLDELTDAQRDDPWIEIPCEAIQNLDSTIECFVYLDWVYQDQELANFELSEDTVITGFTSSNRVRILRAFEGESLTWVEPPTEDTLYIPEEPLIPPWVDPDVEYISEELTYVDGEWVNLSLIEISGNKTEADIDMDNSGGIDKHEILVYFAKYLDDQNQVYDFKKNYRLQSSYIQQARPGINRNETYARGLDYAIYYEPAFYSIRFPKVNFFESEATSVLGEQSFQVQIYNKDGMLQQISDPLDEMFQLDHERVHSFLFTEFVGWARCMAEVGCVERETSTQEKVALYEFYDAFGGDEWRFNDNWLVGDPCTNQWYGVGCNTEGNVISIHFFENHLQNESDWPLEFQDLVHLKHLSIFNGDTEFEGVPNRNQNYVKRMIANLGSFTELEELNLAWLGIQGNIPNDLVTCKKLKFVNLSNNNFVGSLPTGDWSQLSRLEIFEVQENKLTGYIAQSMRYLPELIYLNLSNNRMQGPAMVFSASQKLEGLDLSGNNFTLFPWEYFYEDTFQRLEFVNVNFNNPIGLIMPEACIRFAYCFKRTLLIGRDGNDFKSMPRQIEALIERSADDLVYENVLL